MSSFRARCVRATLAGVVAACFAASAQFFIGIPVGDQPAWLGVVTVVSAVPSGYVLFPLSDPFEHLVGQRLGDGTLLEAATPFGPAMRVGSEDIALVALGTILIVALVTYLAQGVNEMVGREV